MNRAVKILMKRDGMSKKEATELVEATRDELLECTSMIDAEDIVMNNLGLELDYIFDIINI